MYTFTIRQLNQMIILGRLARLRGIHLVSDNLARSQRVCNGIGAGWFPDWLRWLVGVICPLLIVISLPHDIEYQQGGGIRARWVADWHFLTNGLRVAWYHRSRKAAYQAIVLWIMLRLFGAAAFNWKHKRKGAK